MDGVPPFDDKIFARKVERTLAIIKPNAIPKAKEIEDVITNDGFAILQKRRMKLSREQARDFYAEYEGKPFFSTLIDHITSGPVMVLILERPDAVSRWKTIIGPSEADDEKLYYARILRDVYNSLKDPKNAIHGSDSPEKADKEIHFFFPDSTLESILTGDAARDYLSRTVNPILLKGLVQLCRQKPENPVVWLADWLLANNPNKPMIG